MDKRFVVIGVLLVIVTLVIGGTVVPNQISSIGNTQSQTVALLAHGSFLINFTVNGTEGMEIIEYVAANKVDFYFVNSSAYALLHGYLDNTQIMGQIARNHYGNGVYEAFLNSSVGMFPYVSSILPNTTLTPNSYVDKNFSVLGNGTYYGIFANLGNSSSELNITTDVINGNIAQKASGVITTSLFLFVALIAGIIILIYGIIKKPKPQAGATSAVGTVNQEYVDSIYKGIGNGPKGEDKRTKVAKRGRKKR
ncbi:MAG: hypothetical protein KGH61_01540 [Candidatus Micrarchaeota archaeon]|nr:hypothetical protein [Candidatus Micrarchaeota archaeon]MDE1863817.1 hypothetical protein [Candidatus Micrarchaeota archaeon]